MDDSVKLKCDLLASVISFMIKHFEIVRFYISTEEKKIFDFYYDANGNDFEMGTMCNLMLTTF